MGTLGARKTKELSVVAPPENIQRIPLVIVPCGRSKIWEREPERGPTRAAEAYTGTLFALNRAHAERFGDAWVILSAKYGFILPDFVLPGPYEVTYTRASTGPIAPAQLRQQVQVLSLRQYPVVVGLGGKAYRAAITVAFAPFDVRLAFPFAGLPIGRMLQATKRALDADDPGVALENPA